MTPQQFSTVRDLLRYAVTRFNGARLFFGHGSSNALDEAAYLILHTLNLPLDQLEPFLDARLLPDECDAVLRVIEKRTVERVPAAYITNEAWLGAYRFYVDERVIVPGNILDLCTGSACLPILMADAFPNAHIDAVDISPDALEVARRNVDEYGLQDRITLVESDLYAKLPPKKYDLIISNPPYVNAGSMEKLPQEYRHEPSLALAGGADGMDLVRKIVEGAKRHLTPEGVLAVEIGNERAHAEAAFPDLELAWITTSAGDDMVFLLTADQLP